MNRQTVLCIAATGQSGSTLLSRLVSELPAFVAAGEVGRLWDKGIEEDVECSCGEPFSSCPFWTKVGEVAFGGWDRVDGAEVARLRDSLVLRELPLPHPFALPLLLLPGVWPSYERRLRRYISFMRPLYAAIGEVSGGRLIIDSMKIPGHVYMMTRQVEGLDVKLIHLVRDSRGVAYSNQKLVARQGSREDKPFRPQRHPRKTALKWLWFNLSSHLLRLLGEPTLPVRYEDLVQDPVSELRRVCDFAGVELREEDLSFIHDGEADLSFGHIVAGNRMRLVSGPVRIRLDEQWRSNRVISGW